jgi:hypothetical protein
MEHIPLCGISSKPYEKGMVHGIPPHEEEKKLPEQNVPPSDIYVCNSQGLVMFNIFLGKVLNFSDQNCYCLKKHSV